MTPAARSLYIFGIYLVATGGFILGAPNTLLALLRLAPTTEPWLRILGIPVVAMGLIHLAGARTEHRGFFRAMVWIRLFPLITFTLLVALRLAPPIVLLFGVVDAAGGIWTKIALARSTGAARAA